MTTRSEHHSDPDWSPEEVTRNGGNSVKVRELYDPDVHVMLGKMARAVADTQAAVTELADNWKAERRTRKRARRTEAFTLASAIGIVQAVVIALRELGILK